MAARLRPDTTMMHLSLCDVVREEYALDQTEELDAFLARVERSAFRMARHYTGDEHEALDLVQDAMLRFVKRYAATPSEQWRPLFYRVLRNRMHDWHRRSRVRRRVMAWWPGDASADDAAAVEALPGPATEKPDRQVQSAAALVALEAALKALPARQREVFLLRALDGMDVADTARAMGVGVGSVKTHYHRAVLRLRGLLGEHWHE